MPCSGSSALHGVNPNYFYTFSYSFIQPIYGQCFHYIPLRTTKKITSGFLGFSDSMGWEHLPGMGESLTWFMECGNFFGCRDRGK